MKLPRKKILHGLLVSVVYLMGIFGIVASGGGGGGDDKDNSCGTVVDIGPNSIIDGILEDGDCLFSDIDPTSADTSFVDEYRITLDSMRTLTINMRSASIDSYLFLLNRSTSCSSGCTQAEVIADDDDSGGGVNGFDALISMDLAAGTYIIIANSALPETGSYSLTTEFGADTEVVKINGSRLERIYADPVRPAIYVSDSANNTVHVINTSTNTLSGSIPVGSQPTKMDMDSNAQYLFVMNSGGSNLSVISADTRMVVDTINLSDIPDSIAVSSADHLYISMENGVSPAIVSYDVSSIPATALFSDNVSLIITGRTSDHTKFYMHDWSTSLDTPLWDVTASPPATLGSADVSSGATTITPIGGTELVMVSPAFEYWGARFPNYDGDMPVYSGLVLEATVNVEWTVTAAAASLTGANIAVAHGKSVTNPTIPVEDKHNNAPDLHIFSVNNFVEIETLALSDYVLHNGLSYAANGDIYFLKGESVSSTVSVIDR